MRPPRTPSRYERELAQVDPTQNEDVDSAAG